MKTYILFLMFLLKPLHLYLRFGSGMFLIFTLTVVPVGDLLANNIQISNVALTGQNMGEGYILVQLDVSWENSWRLDPGDAPGNWDAAWVFVKFRVGNGAWRHASLHNDGHTAPSGSVIDAGLVDEGSGFHSSDNPAVGVFIYRSAHGTGTFNVNGVQLRWNYGVDGVADDAIVDVRVFAIEMVYVPEGSFYVGSGGTEDGHFYQADNTGEPFQITSEAAITTASSGPGNLWGECGIDYAWCAVSPWDGHVIPDAFPKGYAGFYSMKYSISQQQYVDFLNTLTYNQQNARIDGSPDDGSGTYAQNKSRHKIRIRTPGESNTTPAVYETEHPCVANNYLSWMDGAAYADWAGLRPMTELEYEKAARGTEAPIANEYAWGTDGVAGSAYTLSNPGAVNETIATNYSTTAGNAMYQPTTDIINGPSRVGIFATVSSDRVSAGASYYGIMELSGNLWERTVTVGNTAGREFTGAHGNGLLSTNGNADISTWPGYDGSEVNDATGSGFRGGNWSGEASTLRVSDRANAAYSPTLRFISYGFRAVRSTPPGSVTYGTVTDIDGNVYQTVKIGDQWWMAENLRTTRYRNEDAIPTGLSDTDWENTTSGAYAIYPHSQIDGLYSDEEVVDAYGKLYNWYAVDDSRGLCPEGWDVPSDEVWTTLENSLGDSSVAGGKMKSTRTDQDTHPRWNGPNTGVTNESGFSGLPGGSRWNNGNYSDNGNWTAFWSSTESLTYTAWYRHLIYNSISVSREPCYKQCGFSVRCLKV